MEWPGWTPNGALLREFQSFFLDGEDGRSSVGLRKNVGMGYETVFSSVTNEFHPSAQITAHNSPHLH